MTGFPVTGSSLHGFATAGTAARGLSEQFGDVATGLGTLEVDGGLLVPGVVALLWTAQVGYLVALGRETRLAERLSALGVANAVTVLRGGLYAVVAGFVLVPPETHLAWVPGLCYGTGVALDWIDGTIARTLGRETELGERLDMAFDTFGFVAAPAVAVTWGQLPAWYLLLSVARPAFSIARGLHRRRGRPVYDLPADQLGRRLAGLHMVVLTLALLPVVPAGPVVPLAALALAGTLVVFCRDYLAVTGRRFALES